LFNKTILAMEKTKASATDIVIELKNWKQILKKDGIINLYHKEPKNCSRH
jgi:hypothetical protein